MCQYSQYKWFYNPMDKQIAVFSFYIIGIIVSVPFCSRALYTVNSVLLCAQNDRLNR